MKLATTTEDFLRYYPDSADRVRALYRAGFRHVDLSLYGDARPDSVFMRDGWEKEVDKVKRTADELGMDFVQSHAPGGNPLAPGPKRDLLICATRRAIEICAMLSIPFTVVHLGSSGDLKYDDKNAEEEYFKRNMDFMRALIPTMEKTGVSVLIENSTHANMNDRWYCYTGMEMNDFIKYADHPLFGACWDTGHANIEGHQYADITALKDNLKAIHFNDNRGQADEHVMPYLGTMSVDEVMCGLRDIDYRGAFTFECTATARPAEYRFGDRRVWKDKVVSEMPLIAAEALETALYKCGEAILTAYGFKAE